MCNRLVVSPQEHRLHLAANGFMRWSEEMFWKRKAESPVQKCGRALYDATCGAVKRDGGIRVEDLITVLASIVGELCIETAGDFNPRKHSFTPGSRAFSDRANCLFCGDVATDDLDQIPSASVVGMLRERLLPAGYSKADFPSLRTVFEHFAANIGKPSDWGKVPLAVPEANHPFVLPLRVAYESRAMVDRNLQSLSPDERLQAGVFALSEALIAVQKAIDRKTVMLLALQMVNGMAKTAPMTDEAMEAAKKNMAQAPPQSN